MKLEPMINVTFALGLMLTGAGGVAAQDDPLPEAMRVKIEDLQLSEPPVIRGEPVAAVQLITETWNRPGAAASLLDVIRRADEMGLDPADYHLATLEQLMTQSGQAPAGGVATGASPDLVADLDILLTDSLARLAYHLRFGRVDPSDLDANWNLTQDFGDVDPLVVFGAWLESPDIAVELRALEPQVEIYRDLKAAWLACGSASWSQATWPHWGPTLRCTTDRWRRRFRASRGGIFWTLTERSARRHFSSSMSRWRPGWIRSASTWNGAGGSCPPCRQSS